MRGASDLYQAQGGLAQRFVGQFGGGGGGGGAGGGVRIVERGFVGGGLGGG